MHKPPPHLPYDTAYLLREDAVTYLKCSAGHEFKMEYPRNQYLQPGSRCPEVIHQDMIGGTLRCGRRLQSAADMEESQ